MEVNQNRKIYEVWRAKQFKLLIIRVFNRLGSYAHIVSKKDTNIGAKQAKQ